MNIGNRGRMNVLWPVLSVILAAGPAQSQGLTTESAAGRTEVEIVEWRSAPEWLRVYLGSLAERLQGLEGAVGKLPQKRAPFLVTGYAGTSGLACDPVGFGKDPVPGCETTAVRMCRHIGYSRSWITRLEIVPSGESRIYEMICFE